MDERQNDRFPVRKKTRLTYFDYSSCNYYFLTLCTKDHKCIFGDPQALNLIGSVVQAHIVKLPSYYRGVTVDKFAVMPNHVHMILILGIDVEDGRAMLAPTTPSLSVSHIIQHLKGVVSKHIGHSIWQKSFHDHVIRSEEDYRTIWEYIDTNPYRWQEDCFWQP